MLTSQESFITHWAWRQKPELISGRGNGLVDYKSNFLYCDPGSTSARLNPQLK